MKYFEISATTLKEKKCLRGQSHGYCDYIAVSFAVCRRHRRKCYILARGNSRVPEIPTQTGVQQPTPHEQERLTPGLGSKAATFLVASGSNSIAPQRAQPSHLARPSCFLSEPPGHFVRQARWAAPPPFYRCEN